MTTAKQARHSQFKRGQGVFACRCCGRNTRDTGDNGSVELCEQCYDLAGEENSLSDSGDLYQSPDYVLRLIGQVTKLGGNASCWDDLRMEALKRKLDKQGAELAEVAAVVDGIIRKRAIAAIDENGEIVQTCYRTAKKYGWTVIAKLY